jgi:spore coat polysaccharide biosynthesis protein SpsF
MNVVAIIQARMSSTRLPGKVLTPLAGRPVLAHVVERIRHCRHIDQIVVATSVDGSDDAIEAWCQGAAVACHRGSLHDVLDRYHQAGLAHGADVIVRITADCPAIDPAIVDEVVQGYLSGGYEFFGLAGEFPDGLDCTVFAASAIARAWRESTLPSDREHVGPYIEHHPEWFKCGGLHKFSGLSHLRWTLDEPRDLHLLQAIFGELDRGPGAAPFGAADVLALLARRPHLTTINSGIFRNEGYLKSLAADEEMHVQS